VIGHVGQAGEDVAEISKRVNTTPPAVFDNRINDGAALAGISIADEEPVFLAQRSGTDGVFHKMVVDLDPALFQKHFQCRPLAQSIIHRLAQQALWQVAAAAFEPNQRSLYPSGEAPLFKTVISVVG